MKQRNLTIFLLSATLFATLTLSSCKKESTGTNNRTSETIDAQAEGTLKRIMDFKEQLEYYRACPDLRDGASVTLDDALWDVEALFNLTYAYPELAYAHTVVCDTVLFLDVEADNTVPFNRLTAFYDEMHGVVSTLYHGLDIDNKQFLILDVEEGEREGDAVAVRLHSVQGSVRGGDGFPPGPDVPITEIGPFEDGPLWYYGENISNNGQIEPLNTDAADLISLMLNFLLVPQAPEGQLYFYTDAQNNELRPNDFQPFSHVSYPNVGQYCEFYVGNPSIPDYWLDTDQLNFYYFGERHLVLDILPSYNEMSLPYGHCLFNVVIEDYKQEEFSITTAIGHHTIAYYGQKWVVSQGSFERENL